LKRLLSLLGVVLLVLVFLSLGTASAIAHPDLGATVEDCLACHGPGGAADEVFQEAHDGAIGECGTCHIEEGEAIHGQWTATTDACAACHRTHSAAADGLLAGGASALCEFCHGNTPGNAQTNVLGGFLRYNLGSLRGGGFEMANMNTDTNVPDGDGSDWENDDLWRFPVDDGPGPRDVTSTHSLDVEALIWGSGDISDTPIAGVTDTTLECGSCHDPHEYNQTYRMLRKQPADSVVDYHGSTEYVFVTDQLAYARENPDSGILAYDTDDYTEVDYTSPDVYDEDGNLVTVTYDSHGPHEVTKHSQQLSNWCASCHERYHSEKADNTGAGSTDSGDAIFAYGHKTGDEMVSGTESGSCGYNGAACHGAPAREDLNRQLTCLGCHVAHGTAAEMTGRAAMEPWPGQGDNDYAPGTEVDPSLPAAWDAEWDTRSSLLRLDNRGVCQNAYCHPKGTGTYLEGHEQGLD
jgi:predicted CXXCH cytochrome family protein